MGHQNIKTTLKYAHLSKQDVVLLRTGTFTADELREVATNQLVGSGVFRALGVVVDETDKADTVDLGEG